MNTPLGIRPKLTMSKMGVKKPVIDKPISDDTFGMMPLQMYAQMYGGLDTFRRQSERAARYFNGDQWCEFMEDDNGDTIREDQNIINQGSPALKQNLIKSTIRTLLGQFRTDTSKSVVVARTLEKSKESEMLSNALQYALALNNSRDLDARTLEGFLISGLPIQKIEWEHITTLKRRDVKLKNINLHSVFFNGDIEDPRGEDIRIIGQLNDYTLDQLIVNFGSTPARVEKLKEIYSTVSRDNFIASNPYDPERTYQNTFYISKDITKCRVIEVWEERLVKQMEVHDWMDARVFFADWTKKELDSANELRISKYAEVGVPADQVPIMEGTQENVQKWFFTYYSPYGHILKEGETPFEHGSHPFIITPYPLLDNQIVGLVTDLIDAQRQVNRLLILQDMVLSSSAKNPLIVHSNSLNGQTPEEIAEKYKKVGAVIALNMKQGQGVPPIEIKGSIGNLGISEMVQVYIRMLQDVSGVHPAMQGQSAASGTSGKLYDAQIGQSSLNSKDVMDTFSGLFRKNRDMKLLKTIQQYYKEPRMLAISGKSYTETAQLYDPDRVRDLDFDLAIGQTADSPVYRMVIEDTLKEFLMNGMIDLETFLSSTTMPFSSQMLEDIRKRKEQAQTDPQGAVQGLTQDAQNAGVGGNQQVVNAVSQGIRA